MLTHAPLWSWRHTLHPEALNCVCKPYTKHAGAFTCHMYRSVHKYTNTYMYAYIYVHFIKLFVHIYIYIYMYVCMYVCMYVFTAVCM